MIRVHMQLINTVCFLGAVSSSKTDVQPLHSQERTSVVIGTHWKQIDKVI